MSRHPSVEAVRLTFTEGVVIPASKFGALRTAAAGNAPCIAIERLLVRNAYLVLR